MMNPMDKRRMAGTTYRWTHANDGPGYKGIRLQLTLRQLSVYPEGWGETMGRWCHMVDGIAVDHSDGLLRITIGTMSRRFRSGCRLRSGSQSREFIAGIGLLRLRSLKRPSLRMTGLIVVSALRLGTVCTAGRRRLLNLDFQILSMGMRK